MLRPGLLYVLLLSPGSVGPQGLEHTTGRQTMIHIGLLTGDRCKTRFEVSYSVSCLALGRSQTQDIKKVAVSQSRIEICLRDAEASGVPLDLESRFWWLRALGRAFQGLQMPLVRR